MSKKITINQLDEDALLGKLKSTIVDTIIMHTRPKPVSRDPLLTVPEACAYLRISRSTLYRFIAMGYIVPLKSGRRSLFKTSHVEAILIKQNINTLNTKKS
ncbi:MAG: helix-turn-helix domain-containing protein [Mucinivorans sp.]